MDKSLPLYLSEMRALPDIAPEVYQAMLNGAFVGRTLDVCHNGVSPDMLLEQTYNAYAKEESGLDGITQSISARTKPITAGVSSQLKSMLNLHSNSPHHEAGQTRVSMDRETVLKVIAGMQTNPFRAETAVLVIVSTGQHAEPDVQADLTNVKTIGLEALFESIRCQNRKSKWSN